MQGLIAQLKAEGVDPLALCYFIGRKTRYGKVCDHSYTYTRQYLSEYANIANVDGVVSALEGAGLHCDCEVGLNLGPEVGA